MIPVKEEEVKELQKATTRVQDLIKAEPAYRSVLYKLLALCETPRTAAEVDEAVAAFPEMTLALHSPRILLDWLIQTGGIAQVADGGGSPDGVPGEQPSEEVRWQTTEAGKQAAQTLRPAKRLLALFAQEPAFEATYRRVLQFCATPRARAEIEKHLQGDPALENGTVYPTFFIQELEAAGGLEWTGKWQATEAGKGVIA